MTHPADYNVLVFLGLLTRAHLGFVYKYLALYFSTRFSQQYLLTGNYHPEDFSHFPPVGLLESRAPCRWSAP